MISIGIIEDDALQRDLVKVSIDVHNNLDEEIKYKDYILEQYNLSEVNNELINELKKDIIESSINGLIIDHDMKTTTGKSSGTDIYKEIKKIIKEFPVIILTNYSKEAEQDILIDSDKIYSKQEFLMSMDKEISGKNIIRFLRNIRRYETIKADILTQLTGLQSAYIEEGDNEEISRQLLDRESELTDYVYNGINSIEKRISDINFSDVFEAIEKVEDIIDGKKKI